MATTKTTNFAVPVSFEINKAVDDKGGNYCVDAIKQLMLDQKYEFSAIHYQLDFGNDFIVNGTNENRNIQFTHEELKNPVSFWVDTDFRYNKFPIRYGNVVIHVDLDFKNNSN